MCSSDLTLERPHDGPVAASVRALASSASAEPQIARSGAESTVCSDAPVPTCYDSRVITAGAQPVTGVAVAGQELFWLEGSQVMSLNANGTHLALDAHTTGRRLSGLVLDRSYRSTGFVFVGEVVVDKEGAETFSVVRYRNAEGALGERATMVTGLPVTSVAPVFTLDTQGRIYVATPGAPDSRDYYSGRLLRFSNNGSTPRDNPAMSPVISDGLTRPSGVLVAQGDEAVVTGRREDGVATALRLRISPVGDDAPTGVTVTGDGGVGTFVASANGLTWIDQMHWAQEDVTAVTSSGTDLYVATVSKADGSGILRRLRPIHP